MDSPRPDEMVSDVLQVGVSDGLLMLSPIVQSLSMFAEECEQEYALGDDNETPTVEQLSIVLAAIRDARAGLAVLYGRIERDLLANAGEKRFTVDGLGEVEVRKSTKRTAWDNGSLTAVVVARALDERICDEKTGEYEPAAQAVARVLSECARPSWRVMPLRARGIDPDEFCHTEAGHYSVMLPSRKATP